MTDETTTDLVRFDDWLAIAPEFGEIEQADASETALEIAKRILSAESMEEVLEGQSLTHARDLLGVPLEIREVRWNKSDYDGGPQVYAILEAARLDTGEMKTISCGGLNVMAQLLAALRQRAYPFKARFVTPRKPTAAGFMPLWLSRIPD